jgi:hypothetical protein
MSEWLITGGFILAVATVLAWIFRPCGMFLDRDEQRQADRAKGKR